MAGTSLSDYELWAGLDASGFAIYRLRELELARFHLTVEQATVMRVLQSAGEGMTASELRGLTFRQQNTISILVARMSAAGLVTSERRPGQRGSRIAVTSAGTSLLERIPTESLTRVFSVLDGNEKEKLARFMLALHRKTRGLLEPAGPAIMRYLTRRGAGASPRESEPDGPPSDYRLWTMMDSTRFLITRLRELELAQYGLTVAQASMLRVLARARGPVTARDLENVTLRQHHSVSTLIGRMVAMGLAAREKAPGERSYRILVTQSGARLLQGLKAVTLEMTFSTLTESEKQELLVCLLALSRQARGMLGVPVPDVSGRDYREAGRPGFTGSRTLHQP
jgi:DNA-binding MarR family transcriptional regulator